MRAVLVALSSSLAVMVAGACTQPAGEPCKVASDCDPGLVCGLDGICATFAAVNASFDTRATVDVITLDTADATETAAPDGEGCRAVAGVFEPGAAPCEEAAEVRVVTGIAIASEGHGLAMLAGVANQVIADGFEKGEIPLALHIDGELRAGCEARLAWIRGPEDRNADCTPVFSDAMPFEIPNLVSTKVERAVLDPLSGRLTGLIDKADLIASMDPALRDVAEQLIVLDVDTDGDQIADRASAIMDLAF